MLRPAILVFSWFTCMNWISKWNSIEFLFSYLTSWTRHFSIFQNTSFEWGNNYIHNFCCRCMLVTGIMVWVESPLYIAYRHEPAFASCLVPPTCWTRCFSNFWNTSYQWGNNYKHDYTDVTCMLIPGIMVTSHLNALNIEIKWHFIVV